MAQLRVDEDYRHPDKWWRMAITNTATSGIFSSDRTIAEYNEKIWHLKPLAHKNSPGGSAPWTPAKGI